MICPARVVLLALLPVLAVAAPRAGDPSRDSIVLRDTIAARLGAARTSCPGSLVAGLDGREAMCFSTELEFKRLRKLLRGSLRGGSVVPLAEFDWYDVGAFHEKRVFAGREMFVLRFDETVGVVVTVPSHTCFGAAALETVASSADAEVTPPELLAKIDADYPPDALAARRPGFAMVQAIVLEDGSVGAVCRLYAAPPGLGFSAAARKAVAGYRYRPATRAAVPASYLLNVAVTWEP